jgi:Tfp pilus assembly protein PilV
MRCNFPWNSTRAARRGRRSTRAHSEAGFSLIEVLVSALIVALTAAAVAQALISTTRTSAEQRGRSQADGVAQQDQERLRGLSAQQLNAMTPSQSTVCPSQGCRTVTLDGIAFTVTSTAQFLNASAGASCSGSGTTAAYFRIVSSVNWKANAGRPAVVEASIITPPAGGTLLTKVVDQTSTPLSGVTVSATGPDTASGVTDSTGCTVLAALATGSYAVTLTDSGYVDVNGNPSPLSTSATVTSTGTATPSLGNPVKLGQAGSISAPFQAIVGGVTYPGEADTLSWFGSGSSDTMAVAKSSTPLSSPSTQISAGNLFPFMFTGPPTNYTGNYQVWGGRCQQQRPPIATDKFTVAPASNVTTPAVQEPALNVATVKYFDGTTTSTVKPAHVKLTYTSTPGSGTSCIYSWYPTVTTATTEPTTGWLANPGQPFATTGTPASASGQTGSLSVCADYYTGSTYGYRNAAAANITNTSFTALNNTVPTITISTTSTSGLC